MERSRMVQKRLTPARPGCALGQNKTWSREPAAAERRLHGLKVRALNVKRMQRETAGFDCSVDPQCPDLYLDEDVVMDDEVIESESCRESLRKQWEKEKLDLFPKDGSARVQAMRQRTVKGRRKKRDLTGMHRSQSMQKRAQATASQEKDRVKSAAQNNGLTALEEETLSKLESRMMTKKSAILEGGQSTGLLPVLTHRQEKILGFIVQRALPLLKEEERLKKQDPIRNDIVDKVASKCKMSPTEAKRLLENGQRAKHVMIHYNIRLVYYCARSLKGSCPEQYFGDLVLEGMGPKGLERAVLGYDPQRGHRFSTYALNWIRKSISECIANETTPLRMPQTAKDTIRKIRNAMHTLSMDPASADINIEALSKETGFSAQKVRKHLKLSRRPLSLERTVSKTDSGVGMESLVDQIADTREDETEALRRARIEQMMNLALSVLEPNERDVLNKRYGLDTPDGRPMTLAAIAETHGLTPERIRQIEQKSRQRLRKIWKKTLVNSDLMAQ